MRRREEARVRPEEEPRWHALAIDEVMAALESRHSGLTDGEAAARLEIYGPNRLPEPPPTSRLKVLAHQLASPLVYVLVIAAIVTLVVGHYLDASVIAAAVLLNTALGYVQERKAESSVRALMKLVSPRARVIRDGREREVDSAEIVPGDVVLLESGARVPADLRLVATTTLSVDESLLTGESLPVQKSARPTADDALLGDRTSMAFTGAVVVSGRARGYTVATGTHTELGRVAQKIRSEAPIATPLQQRMDRFAKSIGLLVGGASAAAFALGTVLGRPASDMFLLAVGLAVSAVPESLPVILTVTLAIGVRRMARRNAILRRLPAIETLGSTTVIGSDKTGTLTENRMAVEEVWSDGKTFGLADADASLLGENKPLYLTLIAGVLANEAELYESGEDIDPRGDPTEVALLLAARRYGIEHGEIRERYRVFAEIPFEPERRYSASIRSHEGRHLTFVKGAPERVMAMCREGLTSRGAAALDVEAVSTAAREMAARGLRVLAFAYHDSPERPAAPEEVGEPQGLSFLGLTGMMDPPRQGVREAIRGCQEAGIRVVMITGDHADTARAIGAQLDIAPRDAPVLEGHALAAIGDEDLERAVTEASVFARATPEGKLRIVRALQRRGEVVAVTGDGVNDAPALKAAQIGVAMGRSGTDVAREASDMVLADDNFVSIYAAVEEGRIAFDNIRKVTFLLISTGAAEIAIILTALVVGWESPLLPAQLLWLNLITNGIIDLALAFEPGEPGLLKQRPRKPSEGIISRLLLQRTILVGAVMAAGTLAMYVWAIEAYGSIEQARTVALTTLVIFQMFHVGNCRSEHLSIFRKSPFGNPALLASTIASFAVHVAALHWGPTQYVLRVEPLLDWSVWLRMVAVASTILVAVELHKLLRRRA